LGRIAKEAQSLDPGLSWVGARRALDVVTKDKEAEQFYLVVEDNPAFGRSLRRLLRKWGTVTVVTSVRGAKAMIPNHRWTALVVDLGLPDGSGFEVLEAFRAIHPATPALVFSGQHEADDINRANALGAKYLVKGASSSLIEQFILSAPSAARLEATVDIWEERYGLSDAERDVLLRFALGETRELIAELRNCSPLTVKKQCEHILLKTRAPSMQDAVSRLLREVVGR
jgi:DNA-binding NarL/FixJ family response regulator